MRWKFAMGLGLLMAMCLFWLGTPAKLNACGPFGIDAYFDEVAIPDTNWAEALGGKLGIIRQDLPLDHLVIAYRHLSGLPVVATAWEVPEVNESGRKELVGSAHWYDVRKQATLQTEPSVISNARTTADYVDFQQVGEHAFEMAAITLEQRVKAHGLQDPGVQEWITGQDMVFRSRPEKPQIPEPVVTPEWLSRDREYQRASALFYADRWEDARHLFRKISLDPESAWCFWGAYLQARCWVRQASLGPEVQAGGALEEAQRHLEGILKEVRWKAIHGPTRAYLELVRYRREPQGLEAEAIERLVAPSLGAGEGVAALDMLRESRRAMEKMHRAPRRELPPNAAALRDWLDLMQGKAMDQSVLERHWEENPGQVWMVAGLVRLPEGGLAGKMSLVAAKVGPTDPAFASLRWHLLHRELLSAPTELALGKLRRALKEEWPRWAENTLLRLGRTSSRSVGDWGEFLGARVVLVSGVDLPISQVRDPELPELTVARYGANPRLLSPEVVDQLNLQVPLRRWIELSEHPGIPRAVREDLAQAAWVRAVLLARWGEEKRLRPGLDPAVAKMLPPDFASLDAITRDFRLAVVLMKFPGLSPVIPGGFGRGIDDWVPISEVTPFGTNWWCLSPEVPKHSAPGFLTTEDLLNNQREWVALSKYRSSRHWFGESVLAQAEAFPEDPDLPYALHRFVRLTRNADCYDKALSELGLRCFRILHRRFPTNPWTQKTPVFY